MYKEGKIILVDKPYKWTSFDVVNKIRYAIKRNYNIKKIKVGHAGTLDPLATGLLIICTGKKTKIISQIQNQEKIYSGIITIGSSTPSYDLETEINEKLYYANITEKQILETAKMFIGKQEQTPPIFSAKKIEGKRAYKYAREGKIVKMKSNIIEIYDFFVQNIKLPNIYFKINCSKGTYIRSVANDFGKKLNNLAHLSELRREKNGEYSVQNAENIEKIITQIEQNALLKAKK